MQIEYAIHPQTKAIYPFPDQKKTLRSPNERRNPVFVVPGGGGPINPKGNSPFDRETNILSMTFRVTPRWDGSSFDAERDAFLTAIDHGLPQTIAFANDDGKNWFAQVALVRDPLQIDENAPYYCDFQVDWVMLTSLLETAPEGAAVYGHNVKFGHHAKFGGSGTTFALTANPTTFTLPNTGNGATARTTDPVLRLTGPFGPATPSATNVITVRNVTTGAVFTIQDNLPTATDTLDIDLRSRRVLKNGSPRFGALGGRPAGQAIFYEIAPDVVNTYSVSFVGTAVAGGTNGKFRIKWKAKRGL